MCSPPWITLRPSLMATLSEAVQFRTQALPVLGAFAGAWGEMQSGFDLDEMQPAKDVCAINPRPVLLIYGQKMRSCRRTAPGR